MKTFRVRFERTETGVSEIVAQSYDEARTKALSLAGFEIEWYDESDHIEVVDIDEILPDDDD